MKPEGIHPTRDELFAYRDGELPAERRTLIEAHVQGCQSCRALIDELSSLEAALRRRPDDAAPEYFEELPDAVLRSIQGGEAPSGAGRAAPRPERRIEAAAEGGPREPRRPRLAWAGILSAATAAAAVVAVVVFLAQRGGAPPGMITKEQESPAPSTEPQGAPGAPAVAPGAPRDEGKILAKKDRRENLASPPKEAPLEETAENLKQIAASDRPSAARRSDAAAGAPAPAASLDTAGAPSGGASSAGAYADILRRYGLPSLWSARVTPSALLRAEPELRFIYQMGRTGPDSARVRLYLAEAARLRYAESPDSALYDTVVRHYRRAIRLGEADTAAASVARGRLDSFSR